MEADSWVTLERAQLKRRLSLLDLQHLQARRWNRYIEVPPSPIRTLNHHGRLSGATSLQATSLRETLAYRDHDTTLPQILFLAKWTHTPPSIPRLIIGTQHVHESKEAQRSGCAQGQARWRVITHRKSKEMLLPAPIVLPC